MLQAETLQFPTSDPIRRRTRPLFALSPPALGGGLRDCLPINLPLISTFQPRLWIMLSLSLIVHPFHRWIYVECSYLDLAKEVISVKCDDINSRPFWCWKTRGVIFQPLCNLLIPSPRVHDLQCVVTVVANETRIGFGTHPTSTLQSFLLGQKCEGIRLHIG